MPLKIDTVQKLRNYGESRGVCPMKEDETPAQYREHCALLIQNDDPIEAAEVRAGKGWNEMSQSHLLQLLAKQKGH